MEKSAQGQRVRSAIRWFGLSRGADPKSTSLTDWATAAGGAAADFSITTHPLANSSESRPGWAGRDLGQSKEQLHWSDEFGILSKTEL